jgi:hypothetical protein
MLMEELDGQDSLQALTKCKSLTSMAELKADLTDEKKKVGDRVICHELLTNMLVTSEGVQMPSKRKNQYLQFQNHGLCCSDSHKLPIPVATARRLQKKNQLTLQTPNCIR